MSDFYILTLTALFDLIFVIAMFEVERSNGKWLLGNPIEPFRSYYKEHWKAILSIWIYFTSIQSLLTLAILHSQGGY